MTNQTGLGIVLLCLAIFFFSSIFIPIVQSTFDESSTSTDLDNYANNVIDKTTEQSLSLTGIGDIFVNMGKLFWFNVSGVPFWLDAFYSFLGVIGFIGIAVILYPFA